MSDLLLAALHRADKEDAAVRAVLASLERGNWPASRIVRYRMQGYSAGRIAEMAKIGIRVVEIVLEERGLI